MKLLSQLHNRMGDLWWYSILLFAAQRFGDAVNMAVGLWLVPKYIGQNDLGAVPPLSQAVSLVGLPLSILAIPFMKFLSVYKEKGEYGKIKALLRDVFLGTAVLAIATMLIAWLILPFFFLRVRVAAGSLGLLIVIGSVLAAVSTIFGNAVQGLQLYKSTIWFNLIGAPMRLLTMWVAMPFRALSGYFAGQCAAPCTSIFGAIWVLRKRLGSSIKTTPYWREDGRAIIRYTIPIAVWTTVWTITGAVESLVIRHRLSDFESAGYYMITRFTDIAAYFGSTFIVFLFPMVAGAAAKSAASKRVLLQSVSGTAVGGLVVGGLLAIFGGWLLSLSSLWAAYTPLAGMMFPICMLNVITLSCGCFATYEMAQGRFRFFRYALPILLLRCAFLYAATGIDFFHGMLPERLIAEVVSWQPCRLSFVISVLIGSQLTLLACLAADILVSRPRRNEG